MRDDGRPAIARRIGHRLPARHTRTSKLWHENGLSIVLVGLFAVTMAGQTIAGWFSYNAEQQEHGEAAAMAVFTIFLRQRGSPESKPVAAATWDTGA